MSEWAQQRNGFSAVVFRLLLAVSLWRGPVLWAHDHGAECKDLTTHLAVFHADEPDVWNLGWHWHLSLPENRGPLSPEEKQPLGDPCDQQPALLSGSHALMSAGLSSPSAQSGVADSLASPDCVVPSPTDGEALRVGSRPGTGPSTQQLLCRMNC